jgi:hypothetical protein
MRRYRFLPSVALTAVFCGVISVSPAFANLIGTVTTAPGDSVFPGLVSSGTDPGTLLASLSAPFVTSLGDDSGTVVSAVFREAGGTLDFYYQVDVNTTAPGCGAAGQDTCDSVSRLTATSFTGFLTFTGYRLDGLGLGPFDSGTANPVEADRSTNGKVVGFNFNPPVSANIFPGQNSNVLVISTNATNFTAGNVSLISGGVVTVAAFEPAAAVPEPASLLLLGSGLVGLWFLRLRKS